MKRFISDMLILGILVSLTVLGLAFTGPHGHQPVGGMRHQPMMEQGQVVNIGQNMQNMMARMQQVMENPDMKKQMEAMQNHISAMRSALAGMINHMEQTHQPKPLEKKEL